MRQPVIKSLLQRIRYYEWAYGHLGEADTDIGTIGEFMVGTHLGCLSSARKDHDVFDFTTKSGVSIEVKTTTHKTKSGSGSIYYRWHISDQRSALEGRKPLADRWIFLIATFPESASASRTFNAFDPRYWIAYLATGEQVRSTRCRSIITESALKRLGLTSFPLSELRQKFARAR